MFLRSCQVLGISSGYVQGMFRVQVQSRFRTGSEQVQSRFRAGSEYVQSMFGVCFNASSSASSVSVFGIFNIGREGGRGCSWASENHTLLNAPLSLG